MTRPDATALAPHTGSAARPLIVELVGAAAAGKSTLIGELQRRDPTIRWLQRARGGGGAATLARRVVGFAPAWLAAVPRAPGYTWRHARYFLRLATLDAVVRRAAPEPAGVVILEHGPIFTLARLRAFHDGPLPPSLARYASRLLGRWAKALDLVVVLEAPLEVLAARLDSRPKEHEMRNSTTPELTDFVARWDTAYEAVLAELRAAGGPPLVTLRTDHTTVAVLADRVAAALEERRRAR